MLPSTVARAAVLVGIVLAGFFALAAGSDQWRYDVAHDLYQVGEIVEAHDAEVYYSCGRSCSEEMRAVVDFADGSRNVELPEVSFDRRGLPERQWVPAPEPYDGTFNVYYDPELPQDTRRIRSEEDVEDAFSQDPRTLWIVVGILVIWSLAWMRPASRNTGGSIRVLSLAPTPPGAESQRPDSWRLDVIAAVGLATAGLGILLFSGSAWSAVVAMYLDESGAVTDGSDAAVRVVASDVDGGGPVSDKVFAEIVIKHVTVANEIVPVELVVPDRRVDSELLPGLVRERRAVRRRFRREVRPGEPRSCDRCGRHRADCKAKRPGCPPRNDRSRRSPGGMGVGLANGPQAGGAAANPTRHDLGRSAPSERSLNQTSQHAAA
ncbi:hypothetical protein [Promicromonospora soli]